MTTPQSVQNPRNCSSPHGSERPPRKLVPVRPFETLQPSHEHRSLAGKRWRCGMIIPFPNPTTPAVDVPLGLTDVHETLVMLSLSLALMASPRMPIERARTAAKHAQKVAETYADVVALLMEQGGVQ